VLGAALMTDGAARRVDLFYALSWTAAMGFLKDAGPDAWIEETRRIEDGDSDMVRWPRYKKSDDATIALVGFDRPIGCHYGGHAPTALG
jgi:hypothetical protein